MLEAAPGVRAVAIFQELCRGHPEIAIGCAGPWSAVGGLLNGRSRDVIFRQKHPPGRMGLSDLTDMGGLGCGRRSNMVQIA
jgi:hypothetical protein